MIRLLALAAVAIWLSGYQAGYAAEISQRIRTTTGIVEGGSSAADGIRAFKGIPYAAPPGGPLRWAEPRPAAPWSGVRQANAFGPACPQRPERPNSLFSGGDAPPQSEDCLDLNVWTPAQSGAGRLPVMVWIYGGGFNWGAASYALYDGTNLAKKGVVVVSFNYRTGALGFLVHPELTRESPHHASGNYGLLDQIAALEWVQRNIAAFGGDPSRVTVFGESAGSTSISALEASPLAKGLFQRAIGESTAEMDPAAGILGRRSFAEAEQAGIAYASSLGAASLADLRRLPAATFAKAPPFFWLTEQDGYVLPDTIYATFAAGREAPVDLLVGSNANEGANLKVPWIKPASPAEQAAYAALYPDPHDPQVFSDVVAWQMRTWAALQARMPARHVYLYSFTRKPPLPAGVSFAEGESDALGAYHGSEIVYVFDNLQARDWRWSDADRKLADTMSSYWVSFARTGDPNGDGRPEWPRYDPARPEIMSLATPPAAAPIPPSSAYDFIDRYFAARR